MAKLVVNIFVHFFENLNIPISQLNDLKFQEGYVFGIANLTWTDLNIKITSHVSYGMLHGMFKAYDGKTNRWMISTAHRSQLESTAGCWFVSPDYVS